MGSQNLQSIGQSGELWPVNVVDFSKQDPLTLYKTRGSGGGKGVICARRGGT